MRTDIFAAILVLGTALSASATPDLLYAGFVAPPDNAKPMFRWWWFGPAVEKPEILRELEQMKADGVGGAELAFVYPLALDDPSKHLVNQPFVGPAMLDNVRYAQEQGRRLGLRIDVTLGSGWPYGGPATTLDDAAGRLKVEEIPLGSGVPPTPKLEDGDYLIASDMADGAPGKWDAATAHPLDAKAVANGKPQVALFFIGSHTRQMVKRASIGAEGFVLDPFSAKAVAMHLKAVGELLLSAFGDTPPTAIFSDSLEAYGADWTPDLPMQFKARRGYDLVSRLPELVAGTSAEAGQLRHDWGQTLSELVDENYLKPITDFAHAHGTLFRSQTYGEPAVTLSSQNIPDLAEGEGPQWREFSTLRWATSANHAFGHTVTSAETFTWLHSPVFRATPLDMKVEVDRHFLIGTNLVIGHGWPYSAPAAGEPGWSLYAAAVFNDHNPWHPVMPDVTRYIQRISFMLRQGKPANQVAILLPTDDAWSRFAPGHVSVTGLMPKLVTPALMGAVLNCGYNVDYIDSAAITRVGIHYPVLVLPPTTRIPLAILQAIDRYVANGGKVLAVGHVPTLDNAGRADPMLTALSRKLFSDSAGTLVNDEKTVGPALNRMVPPDLVLSGARDVVGFIRRVLPDRDIYFVANTSNSPIEVRARFATHFAGAEAWDADTGRRLPATANGSLALAPYESRLFVFGKAASLPESQPAGHLLADLGTGWHVSLAGALHSVSLPHDWAADPATRNFSGEARYVRTVRLAQAPAHAWLMVKGGAPEAINIPDLGRPNPGTRAFYDPPVREAALVFVNGRQMGALWHPPYRIDIGGALRRGKNQIEIRITNTAMNAWAARPPRDYTSLIAKYGDRFQMQDLDKVAPQSSGLLGKVVLSN